MDINNYFLCNEHKTIFFQGLPKFSKGDKYYRGVTDNETMSHALWGHPRQTGHGKEFWQNVVHVEKGMANHFNILALRTP